MTIVKGELKGVYADKVELDNTKHKTDSILDSFKAMEKELTEKFQSQLKEIKEELSSQKKFVSELGTQLKEDNNTNPPEEKEEPEANG